MTFILNFHGIGAAQRPYEDGEEPYWISEDRFTALLDMAAALEEPAGISFDDSNASDYRVAAPELRKRGLSAQFFVLSGKLDTPGYLRTEEVAEIDADPLFSIGSHGVDHRPWPSLSDDELLHETSYSKAALSRICDRHITKAALPLGKYDRRTLRMLKEQGYTTIYSSDGGPGLIEQNPVPRYSVQRDTTPEQLEATIAASKRLDRSIMRNVRVAIKSIL